MTASRFDTESMLPADARSALGSQPLRAGQPSEPCAFCWPALIAADLYDASGRACCLHCAGSPNRESVLPAYLPARIEAAA